MTRFARAEGAKGSNKKRPYEGTPWMKMKFPPRKIEWKNKYVPDDGEVLVEEPLGNVSERKEKRIKRRKEVKEPVKPMESSIIVDGEEMAIVRFEGFPVKKCDFETLKAAKKQLKEDGVDEKEARKRLKLERRRCEKALTRQLRKVCYYCRKNGHVMSECLVREKEQLDSGFCFKCGSTEHQHSKCKISRDSFKFASCFICKETGHISKQCPDNPKGMYPEGGACRHCGDVTHMKKDCPKFGKTKRKDFDVTVGTIDARAPDALEYNRKISKKNLSGFKKIVMK